MAGAERSPSLVHIGFHKTGTTWLQSGLFRSEPFNIAWDSMAIARTIVLTHTLDWCAETVRDELSRCAETETPGSTVDVMSWERLSGSPHAGGYDSGIIAKRLHELYPEARILIGVREQRSMIEALYRQYVRDGGVASLTGYLHPRNPAEIPQFRFDHFEYDRLIRKYQELFGSDRVLVLPYERLRHDQDAFVRDICEFCEVDPPVLPVESNMYTAYGAKTTLVKRQLNKIFVRNSLNPAARYYVKNHEFRFDRLDNRMPRVLDDRIRAGWRAVVGESVEGRYERSNARLAELTGLDLGGYGYAIETHG